MWKVKLNQIESRGLIVECRLEKQDRVRNIKEQTHSNPIGIYLGLFRSCRFPHTKIPFSSSSYIWACAQYIFLHCTQGILTRLICTGVYINAHIFADCPPTSVIVWEDDGKFSSPEENSSTSPPPGDLSLKSGMIASLHTPPPALTSMLYTALSSPPFDPPVIHKRPPAATMAWPTLAPGPPSAVTRDQDGNGDEQSRTCMSDKGEDGPLPPNMYILSPQVAAACECLGEGSPGRPPKDSHFLAGV